MKFSALSLFALASVGFLQSVGSTPAMADGIRFVHECPEGTGLVWHGDTPSCEVGAPTHGDDGNQGNPQTRSTPKPIVK